MELKGFYAARCEKCGRWRAVEIKSKSYRFKCHYCDFSTKMKHKTEFGVHLQIKGHFGTGQEAARVVAELNGVKWK